LSNDKHFISDTVELSLPSNMKLSAWHSCYRSKQSTSNKTAQTDKMSQ